MTGSLYDISVQTVDSKVLGRPFLLLLGSESGKAPFWSPQKLWQSIRSSGTHYRSPSLDFSYQKYILVRWEPCSLHLSQDVQASFCLPWKLILRSWPRHPDWLILVVSLPGSGISSNASCWTCLWGKVSFDFLILSGNDPLYVWGHGEYLLVTDKRKDQEKRLGLCLFAFTLAGKFLNPKAVVVATLYWYQTPVPCSSL